MDDSILIHFDFQFFILFSTGKFVTIFLIFTPSLLAFMFALNMLLQANPTFYDKSDTTLKVFSMMVGEFEYDDTFSPHAVEEIGGRNKSTQVILNFFRI